MKMAAGWLLLVCAVVVLRSARAQDPYDQLPDHYRQGVDLALENLGAHAGVQHHYRFLRSLEKSDSEAGFSLNYLYHHFLLKPTTCAKGAAASSPQRCPFRNDRPMIDCAVCYKTLTGQMESIPKPYVHCIQRPRLTQQMRTTRTQNCRKMNYNSGAPTLLAVSNGKH